MVGQSMYIDTYVLGEKQESLGIFAHLIFFQILQGQFSGCLTIFLVTLI